MEEVAAYIAIFLATTFIFSGAFIAERITKKLYGPGKPNILGSKEPGYQNTWNNPQLQKTWNPYQSNALRILAGQYGMPYTPSTQDNVALAEKLSLYTTPPEAEITYELSPLDPLTSSLEIGEVLSPEDDPQDIPTPRVLGGRT